MTRAAPRFWNWWFTIGTIVACGLMAIGVVVIVFAAFRILGGLWHAIIPASETGRRVKRDLGDDQVFLPMIPGVTLPMSHLGYYLFALLFCGLIHEAGHAIASYSEKVPIQSAGVFVYYLYPGAFVNVPDQPLQLLTPFRQLKIVCAGVWHNAILYLLTLLFLSGGLKACLLVCGWKTLEGSGGVSVVDVRSLSPLATHLSTSSVIYRLDDYPLENNIIDWNDFLLFDQGRHRPTQGFCIEKYTDNLGLECCEINDDTPFGKSANETLSCFQDFRSALDFKKPEDLVCLPALDILASRDRKRCTTDDECETKCITPYMPSTGGQIVRIYARMPSWVNGPAEELDKVFLFEGELVDIWESVKVGILQPRFWILPASLPHILELLLRYVSSFTLALALLNILPAFRLDGEFALGQILVLLLRSNHGPVTTRTGDTQRYTRGVLAVIVKGTSVVVGFVIIGSIVLGVFNGLSGEF
ncbi:hypothetical protein CLU79DRAFT_744718 [Phycomyces nitens]|nr:hypothetical protein CLU79DRAFT_744718 [Phycomyces nitens]